MAYVIKITDFSECRELQKKLIIEKQNYTILMRLVYPHCKTN